MKKWKIYDLATYYVLKTYYLALLIPLMISRYTLLIFVQSTGVRVYI